VPRFTRAELESFRGVEVPDLLGPDCRLLFVGINPGLWTAATQTHFAHPANRFYPALALAGIVGRRIDPAAGMTDDDRAHLVERGLGITNLVRRATARAAELSDEELRKLVEDAVASSGASSPKDMGAVMKAVMPAVGGRADGKRVSAQVREVLAS